VLGSVLEPVVGVELPKEVFTSRARWMSLIVEWNAYANMFYFLKNLLLLIMVILKLKCNNLFFNEIMVLNALYVCLHAFSLRRESPDPDSGRRTPYFSGGSVTSPSALPPLESCLLLVGTSSIDPRTVKVPCEIRWDHALHCRLVHRSRSSARPQALMHERCGTTTLASSLALTQPLTSRRTLS
jgi:hypothetical protein